jgi:type I restriction enzyme M protein
MKSMESVTRLEFDLWAISSNLRGFGGMGDFASRLVALLALRKLLDQQNRDPAATMTFADLTSSADPARTLERALHPRLRSRTTDRVYEDLRWLLDPIRTEDRNALSVAAHGIASLPSDVVTGPDTGPAALRFLTRIAGKDADGISPAPSVARLMVELAAPADGGRVADPHCRWGSMLVAAGEWARQRGTAFASLDGSDPSPRTAALARIVLFLADLSSDVEVANVVLSPGTRTAGTYDAVFSVPPIGLRAPPHLHIEASERFRYGAPTRAADWLFVQHALSLLSDRGVAVVLLSRGPLFRSGAEAEVRRGLVEADMIESIVELPSGLLAGTSLPCALLVLRRGRSPERRGTIVMVQVEERERRERLTDLTADVVSTIGRLVRDPAQAKGVRSRSVNKAVLAENDYSLLPSRYFEGPPASQMRDLSEISGELKAARSLESAAATHLAEALDALVGATRKAGSPRSSRSSGTEVKS